MILLNGASSSGKSTLAKALQTRLETPHLHVAEDTFWAMLPERDLPFDVRFRTYYGFMGAVAALARAGNCVIVDTVADDKDAWAEFARLLEGVGVLAVGVRCALETLEARERERGDRGVGTARRQFETVHAHCRYDVEVDTSAMTIEACVDAIVAAYGV